jgi:ferrochelatase
VTTGVLLMAYGTPAGLDDVEAYYTHIRGGRTPAPELVADLRRRYEAIGGTSPLLDITRAQASGIGQALGNGFVVELGMRHAPPFIEDGVAALARQGVHEMVAVVLAPHFSAMSVGQYLDRARAAAQAAGIDIVVVEHWHLEPGYIDLLSDGLRGTAAHVLFTAHSLPARILETGDPYPDQLRESAEAIAKLAGIDDDCWSLAWQSAGRTPEPRRPMRSGRPAEVRDDRRTSEGLRGEPQPWLGPTVLEVLADLAAREVTDFVVCPHGFVADHLEVLYDLDIEAQAFAKKIGVSLTRTPSPNDDPRLCRALAEVIEARA